MDESPAADELEVSIFGPGIGECVLVHLGDGRWMVVDSCFDELAHMSVPIVYLRSIGQDPASQITTVVATHWHDDHIRGLADVLELATHADFFASAAIGNREVRGLIQLFGQTAPDAPRGTVEFRRIHSCLKSTGRSIKAAVPNRTIAQYQAKVVTLSPSDKMVQRAVEALVALIPSNRSPRRWLSAVEPNLASVVLWLQWGDVRVLLGADLEKTGIDDGWTAIVDDPLRDQEPAGLVKVPHHGSINAYVPRVWREMLSTQLWAGVTPFRGGGLNLPRPEGIRAIQAHTDRTYCTADIRREPPTSANRDAAVERTLREMEIQLRNRQYGNGHIRFRRRVGEPDWRVDLYNGALLLPGVA